MTIYCCQCDRDVDARLADGGEIYPHRPDLAALPFWACDGCGNYVGCHHKTDNPTRPLGVIPDTAMRGYRVEIHKILGMYPRKLIYRRLSESLGYDYHTAELRSVEDAERILSILEGYGRASTTSGNGTENSP